MENCLNSCKTVFQQHEDKASLPDVKTFRWLILLPLLGLAPPCAFAQVQVNSAALQQLQGLPTAPVAPPHPAAQPRPPGPKAAHSEKPRAQTPLRAKPPALAAPHQPLASRPSKSAVAPSVPTPPVTLHTPPLPPTIKMSFATGSALLPADADARLTAFCTSQSRIWILAHAPGTDETPNSAMQLAMQRAFAIRDALISCGVAAQNIIPQSTVAAPGPGSDEALIGANTKP